MYARQKEVCRRGRRARNASLWAAVVVGVSSLGVLRFRRTCGLCSRGRKRQRPPSAFLHLFHFRRCRQAPRSKLRLRQLSWVHLQRRQSGRSRGRRGERSTPHCGKATDAAAKVEAPLSVAARDPPRGQRSRTPAMRWESRRSRTAWSAQGRDIGIGHRGFAQAFPLVHAKTRIPQPPGP